MAESKSSSEEVTEKLESSTVHKTVTFCSTTTATLESFTEKYHTEYVTEQTSSESKVQGAAEWIQTPGQSLTDAKDEDNKAVSGEGERRSSQDELVNQDVEVVQEKGDVRREADGEEGEVVKQKEEVGEAEVRATELEGREFCRRSSEPPRPSEGEAIEMRRKGSRQLSDSRKGSAAFVPEKDIATILADVKATLTAVEGTLFQKQAAELRVAVIGAGPAGLCAARHLLAEGIEAEVYEQCADIGGTWVYTEQVHSANHIFPLHSSLYHDLWTNLPKETMQFPDFPYKEEGLSYLPSEKVLQYLVDYADHYDLHKIIKVKHQVKTVAPLGNSWSVTVEDLAHNLEVVSLFDAVMVCSGPNTIPVYPLIEGLAKFSGRQLHSRDYRRAESYAGKTVLVVGLGPSGLDITYQLQPTAKKVILSHNRSKELSLTFPDGVVVKPKVRSLFDKTVTFIDDSEEDVDVIIYCTGYTYNFPFLTEECGLIVDQHVSPLYKHLINIEHPTMCVVGLPKYCPHQYMVDYQVRTFLNILLGRAELPSREEMLAELEADREARLEEGQRKKDLHKLGRERTKAYMDDLTALGKLEPVPPVIFKLFAEAFMRAIRDFKGFRNYTYKILDNDNFAMEALNDKSSSENNERTIT